MSEDWREIRVQDAGLSIRIVRAMLGEGLSTMGEVAAYALANRASGFLRIPNHGRLSATELVGWLQKHDPANFEATKYDLWTSSDGRLSPSQRIAQREQEARAKIEESIVKKESSISSLKAELKTLRSRLKNLKRKTK